jgi:hypothetical protein
MSKAEVRAVDREEGIVRLRLIDATAAELDKWVGHVGKTINAGVGPKVAYREGQRRSREQVAQIVAKHTQGLTGVELNAIMNILDAIEAEPIGELP